MKNILFFVLDDEGGDTDDVWFDCDTDEDTVPPTASCDDFKEEDWADCREEQPRANTDRQRLKEALQGLHELEFPEIQLNVNPVLIDNDDVGFDDNNEDLDELWGPEVYGDEIEEEIMMVIFSFNLEGFTTYFLLTAQNGCAV